MFEFLKRKKKATIAEMGLSLIALGSGSERGTKQILEFLEERGCEVDKQRLKWELFYLEIFAVYHGVRVALHGPMRDAVLSEYFRHVSELARPEWLGSDLLASVWERSGAYGEALARPSPGGPVWNVGYAFSEFCRVKDVDLAIAAGVHFAGRVKTVTEFMAEFTVS